MTGHIANVACAACLDEHEIFDDALADWVPCPMCATTEGCAICAGTGETITDWNRYLEPHDGDKGDEAVAECVGCGGRGWVATCNDHLQVAQEGRDGRA